jgi:hypothetical protein
MSSCANEMKYQVLLAHATEAPPLELVQAISDILYFFRKLKINRLQFLKLLGVGRYPDYTTADGIN